MTLEQIYQNLMQVNNDMLKQGAEPLQVSGVLLAQALSIYKTVLSEEGFTKFMDEIQLSADKVQKLDVIEPEHVH
jgi:hypothetical protein